MNLFHFLILLLIYLIPNINSKCIWYEGIRDNYNAVYLNGEPKPLPLDDVNLLNEMCPHIATPKGFVCLLFLIDFYCQFVFFRCFTKFMLRSKTII
jgi:hypothetical protein